AWEGRNQPGSSGDNSQTTDGNGGIERTTSRVREEPRLELGEIDADIGQYVLDNPADRTRPAGDCAARRAHPPGHGGAHPGAPERGRIRHALSRGPGGRLRHSGLRVVDPYLPDRGVDLYQISDLRPHSDRAGRLLENAGLLRAEGACRHARPRSASDLLVHLEERPRSGI